uniref:Uncharacterized protein n=1 Tax=Siphoviridae sp. ctBLh2 TaxID=2827803 RepID=A0A8S5S3R5_9CAUD|nr:MAG TPA: hypothetical protein [Siphoviridae sp. ctBLh2]
MPERFRTGPTKNPGGRSLRGFSCCAVLSVAPSCPLRQCPPPGLSPPA